MSTQLPIPFEEKEYEYLRSADAKMRELIDRIGPIRRMYLPDPFEALLNSITAQQLSGKVAEKVWLRVEAACDGTVTPQKIQEVGMEGLRAAGLSRNKASYSINIALAALEGLLDRDELQKLSDEGVVERLLPIKGIGRWTAEMFLIFSLCRKDVVSLGDFGIRRGLSILYFDGKMPEKEALLKEARRFSPYGTLASMYLWEVR